MSNINRFTAGRPQKVDPAGWQTYNPSAERGARIETEALYADPIDQFTTFDEDEDDPKVEPAAPDSDL